MAILTTTQQAQLQKAIDLLLQSSAVEIPFGADVIERLAVAFASSGFMTVGQAFQAARDNPISTCLRFAAFLGAQSSACPPAVSGDTMQTVAVVNLDFANADGLAPDTTFSFPNLDTVTAAFNFLSWPKVTSLSLPVLNGVGGDFTISGMPLLPRVDLPALGTVAGNFTIDDSTSANTVLHTISAPALFLLTGSMLCSGNAALTTTDFSSWVPTDGTTINLSGCALSAASIEQIFRRCVLAGVTTCTINVGGGTNAGLASLSAQGQTDKADLDTAGNTVTINA